MSRGPVAPRFLAAPAPSLRPVIEEERREQQPRVSDKDSVAPLVVWPESDRGTSGRKRCTVVGFSDECVRYVSGCTRMTLLKGSASINGYSLPLRVRNEKPWHFPAWFPAAQLHVCCDAPPSSSSSSSSSKRKRADMNLGSLLGPDEAARFAGSASIVLHESLVTILLLEGVDVEEQEWLVAAEDQKPFSLFPVPRAGVDTTHPTCCKLDSALVATATGMLALGIETTNIPPDWVAAADSVIGRVASAPCTVICGAKGVGKSTSLRYTLNRLLRHTDKVCVLDCDLGQPEYSVPGVVSLHAITSPTLCPAYANMQEPVLSFYLGDVTTKNEPDKLIRAIALLMAKYRALVSDVALEHEAQQKLLSEMASSKAPPANSFEVFNDALPSKKQQQQQEEQQLQQQQQHLLPLIVNSDGFVRFMGAEIMSAIFDIVNPTNVLHLCTDKDRHLPAIEKIRSEESVCVSTLQPGRLSACRIASTELRTLRFVAYFLRDSALLAKAAKANLGVYIRNGALADKQGTIASALLCTTTYSVPFQEVYLQVLGGAEIPTRLHLALLNASFVAITAPEEPPRHAVASLSLSASSAAAAASSQTAATFSIKHVLASDAQALSPCLGMGLVRAVDVTHERLLVITPTNPAALAGNVPAICLVRGNIPLPTILVHAPSWPCFPYMSGESAGEGGGFMKARTNVKRRGSSSNNNGKMT